MIEIFNNIPKEVRDNAKFWFEVALSQTDAKDTIRMLSEYRNSCENEEEQEFVDFYFNMRFEQLMN